MKCSGWSVGLAVAVGLVVAGCDGSDDGDDASSASAAATTASDDTATTAVPDTAPASTAVTDTTTPTDTAVTAITLVTTPADTVVTVITGATESASTSATETTTPGDSADGSAAAIVEIGAERFEFRVIQCLRDQPSVFGDQMIEFTLDGVPVDTPDELIEPLLGVMDPDTDMLPLLEPVLEYGPALTVSRFEDGGDYAVVYDLAEIEYLSDPDPLSTDARFLGVGDGDTGTPVAGATTSDGRPMAIAATCP